MAGARLLTLSLSHPGWASRLALEHKGVEHRVVELPPGMHPPIVRALGFPAATVPALRIDGARIQGSLEISAYLERTRPEPPLYPADPEECEAVTAAERWGEEALQPIPRRLIRYAAVASEEVRRWIAQEVVGMPLPGLLATANKPIAWAMGRKVGVNPGRIRTDLALLPRLIARVEELIEAGTLGGELPNAADFQIAPTVRSLLTFTDLRPLLEGRPAAELALRLVPELPEPVPAALPPPWIPERAEVPLAAVQGSG